MQITIGSWIIPVVLTVGCVVMFARPYPMRGTYDFLGAIFRIFWLLPIGLIWAIYFGILLCLKG